MNEYDEFNNVDNDDEENINDDRNISKKNKQQFNEYCQNNRARRSTLK